MTMYATPLITTGQGTPTVPPGLKLATDPMGIPYPVLRWGGYSYWPLSYMDNRVAMAIVGYDDTGAVAQEWSCDGARYIANVSLAVDGQTATFTGQAHRQITMAWRDLVVAPQVVLVDPRQAPEIPSGLNLITDKKGAAYPVLKWGGYMYWPLSYIDNRSSMAIVAYDADGDLAFSWSRDGARYIDTIQVDAANRRVVFVGQGGHSFAIDWDTLGVSYSMCYQATASDLLAIAAEYELPLTERDAAALAAALPIFSCANCGMGATAVAAPAHTEDWAGWLVGAVVGALIGQAIGALIFGPEGGLLGAAVGAAVGSAIGVQFNLIPRDYSYTPSETERQTFLYMASFPIGPFSNGSLWENLFDLPFPRYGEIAFAGGLAPPAAANTVQIYYPTLGRITAPDLTKYPPRSTSKGKVYKLIFVIVQVPNESKNGLPGYQLRIHPEDFYPDQFNSRNRVNHSQLSEGNRFAALLGLNSMKVFAAGTLYVCDSKLIGIDSRTGHYYWGFGGRDQEDIDATLGFIRQLGYDTSGVLQWTDLLDLLSDWF